MNQTKKSHYIPQVYSKNFCATDSKGFLYCKSDPSKLIETSPKNFGVKTNFYAIDKSDGSRDTQTFEDIFNPSEDEWPDLVRKFENKLNLTSADLSNFSMFLSFMALRTPNIRYCLEKDEEQNITCFIKKNAEKLEIDAGKAINALKNRSGAHNNILEESIRPQHHRLILDSYEPFHDIFMRLHWAIFETPFPEKFVTTDNPVVWYDVNEANNNKFTPVGLGDLSVQVIFPITKNLIAIGNRYFEKKFSYGDVKREQKIKQLNKYLVISAEEYIFASQSHLGKLIENHSNIVPTIRNYNLPYKGEVLMGTAATLGPPHKR